MNTADAFGCVAGGSHVLESRGGMHRHGFLVKSSCQMRVKSHRLSPRDTTKSEFVPRVVQMSWYFLSQFERGQG